MSNHFQPTLSRLPVWLRGADDTADPAAAGAKDIRPVFVDPSGYRRILVRGTATTLAAAGVAFMAGAGLLLSNQPLPAAPYDIGGTNSAGAVNGRAAPPAAGASDSLPRGGFTAAQPASDGAADISGSTPVVASQRVEQPGVDADSGLVAPAEAAPGVWAPTAPTAPRAGVVPPAEDPPPVTPPVADPPPVIPPALPPTEEPGLLAPITDPLTTVVGTLLGPIL
jgi:hypothetical protein